MNKVLMYAIIAIIVLAGLGYLAWIIKAALKFIIFFGIIVLLYFGYRYVKKMLAKK